MFFKIFTFCSLLCSMLSEYCVSLLCLQVKLDLCLRKKKDLSLLGMWILNLLIEPYEIAVLLKKREHG